jgi:hypothetical protein
LLVDTFGVQVDLEASARLNDAAEERLPEGVASSSPSGTPLSPWVHMLRPSGGTRFEQRPHGISAVRGVVLAGSPEIV